MHPDVLAMAKAGLASGKTASRVLNDNVKFIITQFDNINSIIMNNKRILLDSRDVGNIRRSLTVATFDINTRTAPEVNVHNLLTSIMVKDNVVRE